MACGAAPQIATAVAAFALLTFNPSEAPVRPVGTTLTSCRAVVEPAAVEPAAVEPAAVEPAVEPSDSGSDSSSSEEEEEIVDIVVVGRKKKRRFR